MLRLIMKRSVFTTIKCFSTLHPESWVKATSGLCKMTWASQRPGTERGDGSHFQLPGLTLALKTRESEGKKKDNAMHQKKKKKNRSAHKNQYNIKLPKKLMICNWLKMVGALVSCWWKRCSHPEWFTTRGFGGFHSLSAVTHRLLQEAELQPFSYLASLTSRPPRCSKRAVVFL